MKVYGVIGSPGFPTSDAELRVKIAQSADRSYDPVAVGRQLMAVLASGSRVGLLKTIAAPTLVLHGADDPLVPVEAGQDTAKHVPGAKLTIIPGMGHDLAPGLVPILVEAIADHDHAADRQPQPAECRCIGLDRTDVDHAVTRRRSIRSRRKPQLIVLQGDDRWLETARR